MSAVLPAPRVKLRAAASRRVPRVRSNANTGTAVDAEPNMRLSRAIVVMLLLHVVAVGGIITFSLFKERGHSHPGQTTAAVEAEDADTTPTKVEGNSTERPASESTGTATANRAPNSGPTLTRVTNETAPGASQNNSANLAAERIASGRTNSNPTPTNNPPASNEKNGRGPADSGKTYLVKSGDSLHSIADHLKVDAAALQKLNRIDDPKKIKQGQTLHIPAAANHPKAK